jgi:glycosyltransferase involved in cell wall biosynthesis
MKYRSDGPAVMLGEPTSLFPAQLAAYWRSKGMEVVLVTHRRDPVPTLPDGTRVVRSWDHETRLTRMLTRRLINPVLYRMERLVPRFKQRFTRITGVSADTELWLPYFASFVAAAWSTTRAAQAQHPRFVFGHEVTTYGLPTALCRGVPRIIFPWGGDVFTYAESSPFHFALTKFCLRSVDLIVPSSKTAASHICERFGVSSAKVHHLSWGVDRQMFKKADPQKRKDVCAKWGIDHNATVVLNPRRFRPDWGAFVALEAFMQLASENSMTHFIMFGGKDTEEFTMQAQMRLEEKGLTSRFRILQGDAPIAVCAELMSVSNLFVSLLGRGDMRSASVLQAAVSGGVPVISDTPEYREMERLGFAGLFVRPDTVEDVLGALRFCLENPEAASEMVARNEVYIAKYEDYQKQMEKLLCLIDDVCADYEGYRDKLKLVLD